MIKNRDKDKVLSLFKILFIREIHSVVWFGYISHQDREEGPTSLFSSPDTTCHYTCQ